LTLKVVKGIFRVYFAAMYEQLSGSP